MTIPYGSVVPFCFIKERNMIHSDYMRISEHQMLTSLCHRVSSTLLAFTFILIVFIAHNVHAQGLPGNENRIAVKASTEKSLAGIEKLLNDAEAMIENGKPGEAYALLQPLEFEHAGEERFDYLIGVAALDSGKPDKATMALERVLVVNPDHAAARMDMARAYYQLGDFPRARTEFSLILSQHPNEKSRILIEKYLDEISEWKSGRYTRVTGYIEGTVGHDSNVNNSTSQSQVFVDVIPGVRALEPINIKSSDNYYGLTAGGDVTHKLNSHWALYAGADLRQRGNHEQRSFDVLNLDARAGFRFGSNENDLRVGAMAGRYNLGNSHNSDSSGVNAEWRYALSQTNRLQAFGLMERYRYVDPLMQSNDYDQQAVGVGWLHAMEGGKSTLFGSLYLGSEKDVSQIISAATPNGGRTDGAKHFSGLRIGNQTSFSENTTLFASGGFQAGEYGRQNYYFQRTRSDRLYDLSAGANWRLDKLWMLRPQLSYMKNESNIDIYGFSKMDVSLTVRRDFR